MIKLEKVTKYFGSFKALDAIDLTVEENEVMAFLGPNGAGKSTTMKILSAYLSPSSGSAFVCGLDTEKYPTEVKALTGFLPEGAPLYDDMTPSELLDFSASIRGFYAHHAKQRTSWAVDKTGIGEVMNKNIETLSKGFKRRVAIAQAIIHDPEVLILDEPTDGLDPVQKTAVQNLILELAHEKKAIIVSTHVLDEVKLISSKAAIIAEGKIKACGNYETLKKSIDKSRFLTLRVDNKEAEKTKKIIESMNINQIEQSLADKDSVVFNIYDYDLTTYELSNNLHKKDIPIIELSVNELDMAKIFNEISKR